MKVKQNKLQFIVCVCMSLSAAAAVVAAGGGGGGDDII
jgi:hypothetical protein